jgi:hypothetical protein
MSRANPISSAITVFVDSNLGILSSTVAGRLHRDVDALEKAPLFMELVDRLIIELNLPLRECLTLAEGLVIARSLEYVHRDAERVRMRSMRDKYTLKYRGYILVMKRDFGLSWHLVDGMPADCGYIVTCHTLAATGCPARSGSRLSSTQSTPSTFSRNSAVKMRSPASAISSTCSTSVSSTATTSRRASRKRSKSEWPVTPQSPPRSGADMPNEEYPAVDQATGRFIEASPVIEAGLAKHAGARFFIASRYPYTFAYDFLRIHLAKVDVSRGDMSQYVKLECERLGLDKDTICCTLADAYLKYYADLEAVEETARELAQTIFPEGEAP